MDSRAYKSGLWTPLTAMARSATATHRPGARCGHGRGAEGVGGCDAGKPPTGRAVKGAASQYLENGGFLQAAFLMTDKH